MTEREAEGVVGGELCVYMRRKMQDKGKYEWEKRKKKKSYQKSFFLAGTLGRDRRLNFGAVLSNSCRQQRKLQKKEKAAAEEEAGRVGGWGEPFSK